MLLSELISTDGADFYWLPYLPVLLHMCLVNFDSARQLVGEQRRAEHAKKLFMNILYVLTIQCELYELTDFLLDLGLSTRNIYMSVICSDFRGSKMRRMHWSSPLAWVRGSRRRNSDAYRQPPAGQQCGNCGRDKAHETCPAKDRECHGCGRELKTLVLATRSNRDAKNTTSSQVVKLS